MIPARDRRFLVSCTTVLAFSTWLACAPEPSTDAPPTDDTSSTAAQSESPAPPSATEPAPEPAAPENGVVCMAGDWDGDGTDEVAAVVARKSEPLTWFFPGLEPAEERRLSFGLSTDQPIVGDWNGDGMDSPGIFREGGWHLLLDRTNVESTNIFPFGLGTDSPAAGDWNGDGVDTPGVFRDGVWHLIDTPAKEEADHSFGFGDVKDVPVAGDWDGDGKDSVGVDRQRFFYLRHELSSGTGDIELDYRSQDGSDQPVIFGDWNGDGLDTPGLVQDGKVSIRDDFEQGPPTRAIACHSLTDVEPVETSEEAADDEGGV